MSKARWSNLAHLVGALPAGLAALLSGACAATGPLQPLSAASQVERGRRAYQAACGDCHSTSELHGEDFDWTWRRQSAWQLLQQISTTMPENDPGGLPMTTYVGIVAYILELNDACSGETELTATRPELAAIGIGEGAPKQPCP